MRTTAAAVLVALLALGAVAQAATPVARVNAGVVQTDFSDASGKPAAVQTRATCILDAQALHLQIECREPQMSRLVAKCQQDADSAVFQDDCLEVFVNPRGGETGYLHFVTNANGVRWAEKGKGGNPLPLAWTVKATRGAEAWTVAMDLPLRTLGGAPASGSVWWLNICRQRQAGGKLELSAWSATGENFHDTARFGALVFDDAYNGYLKTTYVDPWDTRVKALGQRVKGQRPAARRLAQALAPSESNLQSLREGAESREPVPLDKFGALLAMGRAALKDLAEAEQDVDEALANVERNRALAALAQPGQQALCWATTAITNRKVLPAPEPPASLSRALDLRACRGEYEPASFVVYPLRSAMTVTVTASDLRGPGVIPAAAVDLRAVKCWYQAGPGERFPINRGLHLMTPELLLRDDDLIRVDTARKRDYVKLQYPDGHSKWLWISSPERSPEERDGSVTALPIRDAATLQPVAIPARTAKQFWVTVHVPADAPSGLYRGTVQVKSDSGLVETLPLTLTVRPFDLAPNPLESSVYFHWGLTLDPAGSLQINKRSPEQYKAELINLREHGVDNPTISVPIKGGQLAEELKLRQEAGMRNDRLYCLVINTWNPPDQLKQVIELAKSFGYKEFYFYGIDEAQGDKLKAQREQWEQVHAIGGKVFVAGSIGHNFPALGDLQDLLVCYGDPDPAEAARWHSKGHKLFSYANPQAGIEEPETYRRNYGLLLAANNYDGGMTYIYYSGWNDYSIGRYRQHDFVYPTVDGVIDTVQWEGYREGIDDLRYLGTLREAIAAARQTGRTAEADRAQAFVDKMDVTGDLYKLREQMCGWIERLRTVVQ